MYRACTASCGQDALHVYLVQLRVPSLYAIVRHSLSLAMGRAPIPRGDTVGGCDNLVYYLVMHTHMKPQLSHCGFYMKQDSYIVVTSVHWPLEGQCTEVTQM